MMLPVISNCVVRSIGLDPYGMGSMGANKQKEYNKWTKMNEETTGFKNIEQLRLMAAF
jgi:hypothetical protein